MLAAGFTREVYQAPASSPEPEGRLVGQAVREWLSVFQNPAFRPYLVGVFFYRMAFITVVFITPFIAAQVIGSYPLSDADLGFLRILPGVIGESAKPDWSQAAAYLMMAVMIGAMIFFPLVDWLALKTGKRFLFVLALAWMGVIMILTATLGHWPFFTPFFQGLTLFVLASFPIAVAMILIRPLLADVIDTDANLTGRRREGLYNGMEGFIMKIAAGLGPLLATLLFDLFGKTQANNLGIRICGLVGGACLLVAAFTFTRYPIKK
jgi:MFS family permease